MYLSNAVRDFESLIKCINVEAEWETSEKYLFCFIVLIRISVKLECCLQAYFGRLGDPEDDDVSKQTSAAVRSQVYRYRITVRLI